MRELTTTRLRNDIVLAGPTDVLRIRTQVVLPVPAHRRRGDRALCGGPTGSPQNWAATKAAIDKLQVIERAAIGESIFTALQAISTVGAMIGGGHSPPPARIVLLSDGKENLPANPDALKGAFTAARSAKDQGVPPRRDGAGRGDTRGLLINRRLPSRPSNLWAERLWS